MEFLFVGSDFLHFLKLVLRGRFRRRNQATNKHRMTTPKIPKSTATFFPLLVPVAFGLAGADALEPFDETAVAIG